MKNDAMLLVCSWKWYIGTIERDEASGKR